MVSYLYKVVSMVLIILLMSGNITLIYEGIKCNQQKSFFESRKDYSYLMFAYDQEYQEQKGIEAVEAMINGTIYKSKSKENEVYQSIIINEDDPKSILMDSGAKMYLLENVDELNKTELKEIVYFIVPSDIQKSELRSLKEYWEMYYPEKYEYKVIKYDSLLKIVTMTGTEQYISDIVRSPFIIFNNMKPSWRQQSGNITYQDYGTMYRISKKEWSNFISKNSEALLETSCTKTNVYDAYKRYWEIQKKGMIAGIVLLSIMLVIELIILKTIISFEYNCNSMEIVLKKINGYTIFGRYSKIFISMIVSYLIGLTGVLIAVNILANDILIFCIVGCSLIVIIEILFIAVYTTKVERTSIQNILKGGLL